MHGYRRERNFAKRNNFLFPPKRSEYLKLIFTSEIKYIGNILDNFKLLQQFDFLSQDLRMG